MTGEDFESPDEAATPDLGRDDTGWLRVSGRAGCDPVITISRADAARIGEAGP
ncbi:hypothetical protein [Nocardia yunnanensis]|uniref:hypothetical protein n=1 Tax=Nocardia yunnanensis TaxID=2382165 RepID=UPI0013C4860B|nr:hypothetical protein [Nocardia yunnanensis]